MRRLIEVKNRQKRDDIYVGLTHVLELAEAAVTQNWIELYSYE